jgi:hypothetical protein
MLPGALKYGGLPALAGLAAPGELFAHNLRGPDGWLTAAYAATGAPDKLTLRAGKEAPEKVLAWLLRAPK